MPSPIIATSASAASNPVAAIQNSAGAAESASPGSGLIAVGADFAALLLAQMGGEGTLPGLETPALGSQTNGDALLGESKDKDEGEGELSDLAALFAALSQLPAAPLPQAPQAPKGLTEAGNDLSDALESTSQPLLGLGGKDAGKAENLLAQAPAPAGTAAALDEGKTAKFAAFDQTLKQAGTELKIDAPNMPEAPPAVHAAHQAHGTPQAVAPAEGKIEAPVRSAQFQEELSQKIVWMAGQDKQSAQLTLNPPQLGPLEIKLSISGDQATAVFVSPHAEVREAIEAALPRLREMMGSAGVELGQANVSSQSSQQQQAEQQRAASSRGNGGGGILGSAGHDATVSGGTVIRQGNGLVDTFA